MNEPKILWTEREVLEEEGLALTTSIVRIDKDDEYLEVYKKFSFLEWLKLPFNRFEYFKSYKLPKDLLVYKEGIQNDTQNN